MSSGTQCQVLGEKFGMILPLFDSESEWPDALRGVLYCLGMIYFFMGVSIVADTFVASIEVITARRRKAQDASGRIRTVRVWNDTVATLSLMALGSSAPEIALSVVDLFKNNFFFAPLGAQTIVGSAAFNLLVIIAVCIMVVPSSEIRMIKELPAFYVTAAISVFAYAWLVLILVLISPDVVEIWEAAITLACFPLLIFIAYQVDVRGIGKSQTEEEEIGGALDVDADKVCCLQFENEAITIQGSTTVEVVVRRTGSHQCTSCSFQTEGFSAIPGYDFEDVKGCLEFQTGQMQNSFMMDIPPRSGFKVSRRFLVTLCAEEEGVQFNPETDGGKEEDILTVTIAAADSGGCAALKYLDYVINVSSICRGFVDWKDQFMSCLYCNGSPEDQAEATKSDWVLHIISFPWKVIFAFVPPTSFFNGWACFFVSLAFIGGLTAWISDLAELFGFILGICDDVTALAFVALGTSMPDLFASLTAAKEEPTADASIVNVTGSNSVNVFLGLGLPWTIGAIYWAIKGRTSEWDLRYAATIKDPAFVVEAKNIGFCVLIFSCASIVALAIIHLRRKFLGAELGGAIVPKIASSLSFVFLWAGFIGISSWKVMRGSAATTSESLAVMISTAALEMAVAGGAVILIVKHGKRSPPDPQPTRATASSGIFSSGDHRKRKTSARTGEERATENSEAASAERQRVLRSILDSPQSSVPQEDFRVSV